MKHFHPSYLLFSAAVMLIGVMSASGQVKPAATDYVNYEVHVTSQPGELRKQLGAKVIILDSLIVKGPLGEDDLDVMWRGHFYGQLTALNLQSAQFEGGKLPDNAFFQQYNQYWPIHDDHYEYRGGGVLRHIMLPEGVTEIGKRAFFHIGSLKTADLPSTLKVIDDEAFSYSSIKIDRFPDKLERIGGWAFMNSALSGDLVLPSSLRSIGRGAFMFLHRLTSLTIEEGLTTVEGGRSPVATDSKN